MPPDYRILALHCIRLRGNEPVYESRITRVAVTCFDILPLHEMNFLPFPVLRTDRLFLRPLAETDVDEIFLLRSDSQVNLYLYRQRATSGAEARIFIEAIQERIRRNESIYWAITKHNQESLIGTVCLFDFTEDNSAAEIGYELLPSAQGNGFMREALEVVIDFGFRHIGLNAIEACTHIGNLPSLRLLEQFNFLLQGPVSHDSVKMKLFAGQRKKK